MPEQEARRWIVVGAVQGIGYRYFARQAAQGLGQEAFKVLLSFMENENFWVKVCGAERVSSMGAPFTDAVPFAQALIAAAPDRILWGTDWPHPNVGRHMPNDGDLVDLFPLMAPEAALQKKIQEIRQGGPCPG